MDRQNDVDSTEVGRFYDRLRVGPISSAAVAHGEEFIGQECVLTPGEILAFAQQAGITAETRVLDVGSGTGGPACYLAQHLGCQVLGLDVSAVGHGQAVTRARESGLSHLVQFRLTDIHQAVTLPQAHFDVVLGLDSWCHIPRRAAMLQRCTAFLRPGGRMAFYDHIECGPIPEAQRARFYALWHFPGLETPQSYAEALQAAGLQLRYQEVTSAYVTRYYTRLLTIYQERRAEFEASRGPERYQEGLTRLQMTQQFAAAGLLGQVAYIAEK